MKKGIILLYMASFINMQAFNFVKYRKKSESSEKNTQHLSNNEKVAHQKNATNTTSFKTKIIDAGKFIKRKINEKKEAIKGKLNARKYRKQLEKEVYGSKISSNRDIISFSNPLHSSEKMSYAHDFVPVHTQKKSYTNPLFDDSVTSEYVQMVAPKSSIKTHEDGMNEIIYEDV